MSGRQATRHQYTTSVQLMRNECKKQATRHTDEYPEQPPAEVLRGAHFGSMAEGCSVSGIIFKRSILLYTSEYETRNTDANRKDTVYEKNT